MKLRTGLKALIGISVLGIAVAIVLIYTCSFAGQIAFSTLVRQVPMEHGAGPVRSYPVKETKLFDIEVSPLGIIVLLLFIAPCFPYLTAALIESLRSHCDSKSHGDYWFPDNPVEPFLLLFSCSWEVVQLKEL